MITGGMGFIGHHLARCYLDEGWHVTVVDNLYGHYNQAALTKYRMEYLDSSNLHFIKQNCFMEFTISEQLKSHPTSIIHLASYPNQASVELNEYDACSSMIANTHVMAKFANTLKARFVYVSSSMAYGNFTRIPMTEEQPLKPINLYGMLKAQGEDIAKLACENTIIVRPSAVYGPGDNNNRVIGKWIKLAMENKDINVNNSKSLLDFTYVTDLVQGIIAAEHNGIPGIAYNLTYGQARSLGEAAELIKDVVGSSSQIFDLGPGKFEPQRGTLDINKAKEEIGYKPRVNLEEGIKSYIGWMLRYSHVHTIL
jgi:nucleoside-diphosphate-sugar epimerase